MCHCLIKGRDNHVVLTHANLPIPKSSKLYRDVWSIIVFNQKYDPRIDRRWFPKIFQKWNRTPKGSSNLGSARVYLFFKYACKPQEFPNSIGMYRVVSSSTKSTTLALTDVGSQKSFKNRTERRKARQISVVRESIFLLVRW